MEDLSSLHIPSPLQEVKHKLYSDKEVKVWIKREDLIHPHISGNKWRKLKYNIREALEQKKGILTFGGAFSNHIYATAHAAKECNISSVGIIRGEYVDINNPTLAAASRAGMQLKRVSHEVYSQKEEEAYLKELQANFPNHIIVPEGGNNMLALEGVKELGEEINQYTFSPDLIAVSAGTATTAKGLLRSIQLSSRLFCFSSLKGDFLKQRLLEEENSNWDFISDFHFGGYAKVNSELVQFINRYREETDILLDPIYTGKMVFGLHTLLEQGEIAERTKILIIHTGGLQGIAGHNLRYKDKPQMRIKKWLN